MGAGKIGFWGKEAVGQKTRGVDDQGRIKTKLCLPDYSLEGGGETGQWGHRRISQGGGGGGGEKKKRGRGA